MLSKTMYRRPTPRFAHRAVARVALRSSRGRASLIAHRARSPTTASIAEGMTRGGKPGANHLRIAKGSAGEALAALDVADFRGCEARRAELRRIGAMVSRLRVP